MPRLSLYKPERGNDYHFLDRQILEMFTVGGTDVHLHKYLGTDDGIVIKDHTQIQDMIFMENRDRKYDPDIYKIRGIYNVQDIDFDLSQFGLFLSNDTLFLTIHINGSVKSIGRKIMSGDVIELPHLVDEYAANDKSIALKRFYVVEDVNRASEGFSPTWYPHLYRVKLKQLVDSQEFKDILDLPADENLPGGDTLRDLLSTYDKEMQINNAVVAQAEADAPKSGYNINHFYTLALNVDGSVSLQTADQGDVDASNINILADEVVGRAIREGYSGYLLGTGDAPNGAPYGMGISFPTNNLEGDYFLRTDFMPKRLFRYDGNKWTKVKDDVRVTLSNTNDRNTQIGTFINNTATSTIGGEVVVERQSLSKALRPKADN
tara:strand:+ start:842 stop:1972 length:1131 start_codon:yes stop_codon:yes gene_type:complete